MNITILGSTGSIGQNTLDVIARSPQRFSVFALSAQRNVELLRQQCLQYHPRYAVMTEPSAAEQLRRELKKAGSDTEVLAGAEELITIANHPQTNIIVAAIVGAAGLLPTLAAARASKRILLANKEALVMTGALLIEEVRKHKAVLLPIDSEHNAILQCMPAGFVPGSARAAGVKRILLTASGGPFRTATYEQLTQVTPEQACAHPNWVMGRKISVDSATMMNKALEVIEAYWLFNIELENISVLLHPQSIIHSLVEYEDGSVLAQLGNPDMRTPIAYTLAWPERIHSGVDRLDLLSIGRLDFAPVCDQRYPALNLAYQAMKTGGTATTILNAANEVAVQAFLDKRIAFTDIVEINHQVLEGLSAKAIINVEGVLTADREAREAANQWIERRALKKI